jgi:hypothetical protein
MLGVGAVTSTALVEHALLDHTVRPGRADLTPGEAE